MVRCPGRSSLLVAAFLAVGCGDESGLGPNHGQGVDGLALRGPVCPVAGPECPDEPYPAQVRIFTLGGIPRVSTQAGADGRFTVGLAPGRYRIVGVSGDPFPVGEEVEVEVVPGEWITVTLHFDTGIR